MVDRKMKRPDVVLLTSHEKMLQEPRSEWALTARLPIALTDMTGGIVPLRANLSEGKRMYGDLAQASLSVFSASKIGGGKADEFIAVGPSLTAEQVNGLFYFAAPYKGFGFDTQDIINDWTDLYNDPAHENRKKAHAKMPGWSQFENSRERILGVLQRNYQSWGFRQRDTDDVVIPVIRWRRNAEGKSQMVLEPLDESLQVAIAEVLPEQIKDTARLDSGMGMMFIAAYSPDQTRWPSSDGYKHSDSLSTQTIGPTQVLAYAYREVARQQADASQVPSDQDLQRSVLLSGLGSYAETGELPVINIEGTPIDSFSTSEPKVAEVGEKGMVSTPFLPPTPELTKPIQIPLAKVQKNPYLAIASVENTLYESEEYTIKPKNLGETPKENLYTIPKIVQDKAVTIFDSAKLKGETQTIQTNYEISEGDGVFFN